MSQRILFVDDDSAFIAVNTKLLRNNGFEVKYLYNPDNLVNDVENFRPDLILMDITFENSDIDGIIAIEELQKNCQFIQMNEIPILFITAYNQFENFERAKQLNPSGFISKPFFNGDVDLIYPVKLVLQNYELEKKLKYEINEAKLFVDSILPKKIIDKNISTDYLFIPSNKIGGDMIGYHWIDSDNFALYIIDVCDHTITSSLYSTFVINVLNFQLLKNVNFCNPAEVTKRLNELFFENYNDKTFFSMWYGVYNTKEKNLSYICHGHPSPILIDYKNDVEYLKLGSTYIGIIDQLDYKIGNVNLDNRLPFKIYLFTDGAFEIKLPNKNCPDLDSIEFLYNYFRTNTDENNLSEYLQQFLKIQNIKNVQDDFTILKVSFS